MYASQPHLICPTCGQQNPQDAIYCASCGAQIEADGDPLANSVAGAPVPSAPPSLRSGIDEARSRLEQLLPEVTSTLAERVARLHRLPQPPPSPVRARLRQYGMRDVQMQWRLRRLDRLGIWWPTLQPIPAPTPPPLPLAARAAWFILAGIWLSVVWVVATWLVLCTIVGRPLAARMLDLMPTMLTLAPTSTRFGRLQTQQGLLPVPYRGVPQHELPVRAVYFLIVGWWASLVWMILAYLVSLTAVGLPLGYRMFGSTPTVAHLERH